MSNSVTSRLGDVINGYVVVTQYKDEVILAEAINPENPDKAVVWRLDYEGEPYSGGYFSNLLSAQKEFSKRAFGW